MCVDGEIGSSGNRANGKYAVLFEKDKGYIRGCTVM